MPLRSSCGLFNLQKQKWTLNSAEKVDTLLYAYKPQMLEALRLSLPRYIHQHVIDLRARGCVSNDRSYEVVKYRIACTNSLHRCI